MNPLLQLQNWLYKLITDPIISKSSHQLKEAKKRAAGGQNPARMNNATFKYYRVMVNKLEKREKSDLEKKLSKWKWLKPN
jgi:DNA/RNA endonuclease G (NUC1)